MGTTGFDSRANYCDNSAMPQEQSPQPLKPSGDLKRIHTYESDVEELMQKQQTSKAAIAIAEDKRRVEESKKPEPPPTPSAARPSKVFQISSALPLGTRWNFKLITVVAVALLMLAGIGVGAFFFVRDAAPPKVVQPPKTNVPQVSAVVLQGKERRAGVLAAIRDSIKSISVPQTEVRTLPLKRETADISTGELLALLETHAPASLIRALGEKPTLGIYGFQGGQTFLLFSVTSYDYAFSGMLEWEPKLLDDIGPLFGVSARDVLRDVGSTTEEALQNTITIKDVIIRNKDARAAFAPDGSIVFLYSFIDKQTLVFATNEDTLKMLIAKAGGGKLR